MQAEIVRFKAEAVQAPQRAKVAIKRRLDQQVALIEAATRLSTSVAGARTDVGQAAVAESEQRPYSRAALAGSDR